MVPFRSPTLYSSREFVHGRSYKGADLDAEVLPGAYLQRADHRSATLVDADLAEAVLRQVDLRGVRLERAMMD